MGTWAITQRSIYPKFRDGRADSGRGLRLKAQPKGLGILSRVISPNPGTIQAREGVAHVPTEKRELKAAQLGSGSNRGTHGGLA